MPANLSLRHIRLSDVLSLTGNKYLHIVCIVKGIIIIPMYCGVWSALFDFWFLLMGILMGLLYDGLLTSVSAWTCSVLSLFRCLGRVVF